MLSGWNKRKVVTVTGYTNIQTNYQLKLNVLYDNDMRADFDDIRFTMADGITLIDHWLESKIDSVSAVVWVEVPLIPAHPGNINIYMYYGNPAAASTSNGINTFECFDDFSIDSEFASALLANVRMDRAAEPWNNYPKIIQVVNGDYLAAWNAGTSENTVDCKIRLSRSTDKGITWSIPIIVVDTPGVADTTPFFIQTGTKTLLFFNRFYSLSRADIMMMDSIDNGNTWSSPLKIESGHDYNIPMTNGIKLRNSKLIIPWGYMEPPGGSGNTYNASMSSINNGETWVMDGTVPSPYGESIDEPSIVELSDGTLYMTIRSNIAGNMRYSTSSDEGRTWSVSSLTSQVSSVSSPAVIYRKSFTPNIIYLVSNPSYPRNILNLYVSYNDAVDWKLMCTVTTNYGEYPGIVASDGRLTIVFGGEPYGNAVKALTYDESMLLNKWTVNQGTWKAEDGVLKQKSTVGSVYKFLYQDLPSDLTDYIVHAKFKVPTAWSTYGREGLTTEKDAGPGNYWHAGCLMYDDKTKSAILVEDFSWNGIAALGFTATLDTWYSINILRQPNIQKVSIQPVGTPLSWQSQTFLTSRTNRIAGLDGGYDNEVWFDDFYVRKYVLPDPTYTFGVEETVETVPSNNTIIYLAIAALAATAFATLISKSKR